MKSSKGIVTKAAIIIICVILIIFSATKMALSQVIDSSFYKWTVYELQEDELSDKQCYMVLFPVKTDSDQPSRQKPYLMINRYKRQRTEEVSVYGGYEYKDNSRIFLAVDDKQFRLMTKKDMAWARNKDEDISIINAMLNGAVVKVRSDSAVGTFAIDEYSLQGVTRAYARMRRICE